MPRSNTLADLAPMAERVDALVGEHMLDGDGLCRSFINAATLEQWTNDAVARFDLEDFFQNAPDKAGCLSYENSLMSTSEYTLAGLARHDATGDADALAVARRGVHAIMRVAEEGRHYMPGYLPKPFGGLDRARHSHEISPDQYIKAVRALHTYKPHADAAQAAAIDQLFVDIADFFITRKFRHAYRHRTIVTAKTHHHALSLFVPICVLAANVTGDDRYRRQLAQFDEPIDELPGLALSNYNMASLLSEGFDLALGEGHADPRLRQAIADLWHHASQHVDDRGVGWEPHGGHTLRSSQATRLASMATIVERHHPSIDARSLAVRILSSFDDLARDMRHYQPEDEAKLHPTRKFLAHSICDTAVTSWLLAYWRLAAAKASP